MNATIILHEALLKSVEATLAPVREEKFNDMLSYTMSFFIIQLIKMG